jgi:hypothetical protein
MAPAPLTAPPDAGEPFPRSPRRSSVTLRPKQHPPANPKKSRSRSQTSHLPVISPLRSQMPADATVASAGELQLGSPPRALF